MNNPLLDTITMADVYAPVQTGSRDMSPALSSIFNMGASTAPQQGDTVMAAQQPTFSYAQGGMIGPGGAPEPMGAGLNAQGQQGPISPQMMEMQLNQFASQHPQQVAQIRQAIQEELASGGLTQQELNTIVQLATVAAQNPAMYPYVRNFAIQQGLATEQDLSPEYDPGLIFVLLLAARSLQAGMGGQNMMQGGSPAMAGGMPQASMRDGGEVPMSKKGDGSVLINAHEGEYVIPAKVVKMKGKEFFDSLVEKYKEGE